MARRPDQPGYNMSDKHDKEQRRKKKLREREQTKKSRTAIIRDGEKRIVIRQGSTKGYDVQMIRDFLDHLLLELRVQHFENLKLLKALRTTDDLATAMKVTEETSRKLIDQLGVYQKRYQSSLITSDVIDGSNTTEAELKAVMTVVMEGMSAKRDRQIGHLEALQDLIDEALFCARHPLGVDQKGNLIMPTAVHEAREILDQDLPDQLPTNE
jgi:hypothetical protein